MMLSVIWSGAGTAADVFWLAAAIVAAVATVINVSLKQWQDALVAAALAVVALGLLAI